MTNNSRNNLLPLRSLFRKKNKEGMVTKRTPGGVVADIVIYGVLILIIFVCVVPLWHVLMASFSDGILVFAGQGRAAGIIWFPVGEINLRAYEILFEDLSLLKGFANTLLYIAGTLAIGMTINVTAGYVLSRKSQLKPIIMIFVILTVMFNGGLVPTYKIIFSLGFVGTRWALLIPGCTNAFFVIMLSNAFKAIPEATVEAAEIDGAGHFRIMLQVMLPQARTFTTVIMLNSIVMQWNAWFPAMLYLEDNMAAWPLQAWVREFAAKPYMIPGVGYDFNRYLVQYAVIIIATIPMLCAFPFFQKIMEKGTISGAVKG